MNTKLAKQLDADNRQLLEHSAAALGLAGYWDAIPGVVPHQQAFYISRESAGTMAWAEEWNPIRDDHTRYSLIRGLGLLTRNRELLDKHIAVLQAKGLTEAAAVDKAIVCAAAELGEVTKKRKSN